MAFGTPILEPSISGAVSVSASDSVAFAPQRQLAIICTAAGNVKVGWPDGSTFTFPVSVGMTVLPWAVNQVFVTGTTATATYEGLK